MHTLWDDVRFAHRMFLRRRRFAALLVATIAIGVGAATSIFSLVDTVLWKPLPYRDADRLYWIARTDETWRASPVLASVWDNLGHALPDYGQWAGAQRSFDATAAWFTTSGLLATSDGLEQIEVGRASASLARLLGIRPPIGRWFLSGEDARGGPRVVVLGFETWQRRYGGRRDIIGTRLTLNGEPFEIVGITPRGFRAAGDTMLVEVWTPAGVTASDWQRNNFNFHVIGRLRRGTSIAAAAREAAQLLVSSDRTGRVGIRVANLQDETIRNVRRPLTILVWSAVLLLVIACSNVGTLLVGETAARDTEISTRVSLGATRSRVTRQLLTENLLLATLGGAGGCVLSVVLVRVLRFNAPSGMPRIETAHVDTRVLAFAALVTALASVVFSIAPMTAVLRLSPASILRAGSARLTRQRGAIERGGVFIQSALVVVLLAAAALLVRTHQRLVSVDAGFRATQVLAVRTRFPAASAHGRDAASTRVLLDGIAEKLRGLPGVENAAATSAAPFQTMSTTDVYVAGSPLVSDRDEIAGTYAVVSPRYFVTLGIPLRAGRLFGAEDDGPGAAIIVSESFARAFWPNASVIGRHVRVDETWHTVVGVVADVRHRSMDEAPRATFYLPAAQTSRPLDAIVVRTLGDPRPLVPAIRKIIAQADPTLAIARADRLADLVDATLVAERFRTGLLIVFAATALVLAAVGIAGVAANAVARRRRELAIRMAVGAAPGTAMRIAITQTVTVAVAGAVVGIGIALGAARALQPFLYGITPADRPTYAVVLAVIVAVACVAAWIPARHLARVDLTRVLAAN
jgi:putative ABC transport system permease protein